MWLKKVFGFFPDLLSLGKIAIEGKVERKKLLISQDHEIISAQTKATVDRIMNNTQSDNEIDLITARQKSRTWKDEVITYTIFTPVLLATLTPFIIGYNTGDWTNLSEDIATSYRNLAELPTWYHIALFLVIIDVLGFRSFARKVVDQYVSKKNTIFAKK
tara:strand:- start:23 stop:502 length:480 start_codon:yes stop_codon:yes gene_type:complete